jgi:hypothetical protein
MFKKLAVAVAISGVFAAPISASAAPHESSPFPPYESMDYGIHAA